MQIQTELDVDNSCHYLNNNKVDNGIVESISIEIDDDKKIVINYTIKPNRSYYDKSDKVVIIENLVGKTKEALLAKL